MAHVKRISFTGKFYADTFNHAFATLWGASGRIRGLEPVFDPGGSVTLTIPTSGPPAAFLFNGIIVEVTSIQAGVEVAAYPIPLTGPSPYAIVASTPSEKDVDPVTISLVSYTALPEAYPGETFANRVARSVSGALIAYTDPDSPGTKWLAAPPLGIKEILDLLTKRQFSDQEVRILTNQDGNLDDANDLHLHRGLLNNKVVFQKLTNLNYDVFPHTTLPRVPENADELHSHENLPTNREIELLTGRGGVQDADEMHHHKNLPTDEGFIGVFGGPSANGDPFHTHPRLRRLHSATVINPTPTIYYAPQNKGEGDVFVLGSESTFQGSIYIVLGHADGPQFIPATGINAIVGIKFKENARFYHDDGQSAFGNCGPGSEGTPVVENTDTFGPTSIYGATGPQPFNTTFTWRGLKIKSVVPATGTLFVVEDFFTSNGISANTAPSGSVSNGLPALFDQAHERFLSLAGLLVAPVLDRRYVQGGYFSIPYA